eukprot:2891572-Rhodomonas_salina.2
MLFGFEGHRLACPDIRCYQAAKDGKVADIRALLDRGAKASTALDSYGMTALHYAAWYLPTRLLRTARY